MSAKNEQQGGIVLGVDGKGPWDMPDSGSGGESGRPGGKRPQSESGGGKGDKMPPRNPWDPEPDTGDKTRTRPRGPSLEDLLRRTGGGKNGFGGLPTRPDGKSWWPLIIGVFVLLWIGSTSIHRLDQQQQGVITTLGKYSRTENSGLALTLPAPFEHLEKVDTGEIRTISIGSAKPNSENLVLTKDQSLVDMAYDVRWSIKNPEQYLFQLDDPAQTVQQVAESAMRAAVANFDLVQVFGAGRADIAEQVRRRMQAILDEYQSGVRIDGVSIQQTDPPAQVNDAFRAVTAARQQRESNLNEARATASRITQAAEGAATEFDKIYEQYKQAPEVTRRRLYYETMESVLGKVDKTVVESGRVTPYLPLPELKKKAAAASDEVVVTGKTK